MEIEIRDNLFIRKHEVKNATSDIWFIHAFADSGLSFKEVFESPLTKRHNIYVPDLPGFGVSPFNQSFRSIKDYFYLLERIINKSYNGKNVISVVAHSIGGLIGTWLCSSLKDIRINYINVEGNLTLSDFYFSGKVMNYENKNKFYTSFRDEIYSLSMKHEKFKRYYANVQFADPEAMMMMAKSAYGYAMENVCGHEFNSLDCKKVYVYGNMDTPENTIDFINETQIPAKLFKGIGHWHMIENSEKFYNYVQEFIE